MIAYYGDNCSIKPLGEAESVELACRLLGDNLTIVQPSPGSCPSRSLGCAEYESCNVFATFYR